MTQAIAAAQIPFDDAPKQTASLPIPRATVEDAVRHRDNAIRLYEIAWEKAREANEAVLAAHREADLASAGISSSFVDESKAEEVKRFRKIVQLLEQTEYLRVARRLTDGNVWAWVVEFTELERLMDKDAKDKLRDQMRYIPDRVDYHSKKLINQDEIAKGMPPVTVDNVYATIEQFMQDSGMIFRRGIANAFSKLDRRFRSHDGFKIGNRIILTRYFDSNGRLAWGSGARDTLMDIERTFAVLDGVKITANYASTLGAIDAARDGRWDPHQSIVETPYFKIRIFMNGNAHLWMLRDDLVTKVNKLLAEYYGEVIGDGNEQEEDVLNMPKTTPAKRFGFFPTPEPLADKVFEDYVSRLIFRRKEDPQIRILEPSAGTGNLARRCVTRPTIPSVGEIDWRKKQIREHNLAQRFDNLVDCVEVQSRLAEALRAERIYNKVLNIDFLTMKPDPDALYDLVLMNPPFDRERDIDHVMHALKFLKPTGKLIAIMSAGTEWRETRKAIAFRKLVIDEMKGHLKDLPAGSFSSVGTNVNTCLLRVYADKTKVDRWG